jgi:PAS domain S-box-containing protein
MLGGIILKTETIFHSFIKYTPAIIYTAKADETRSILYISPQVENLLGFSDIECITRPDTWYRLIHPEDRGRVMNAIISGQRVGTEKLVTEYHIFTRDGKLLHFHDQAVKIPGEPGNPPYLQGIMLEIPDFGNDGMLSRHEREIDGRHDVTQQKKNEEMLLEYQKKLRSMATKLSMVEERERRHIARDIHDYISQSLVAAKIKIAALTAYSQQPPAVAEGLGQIGEFIDEAIGYTQSLITNLSLSTLHDIDFSEALEWLSNRFQERHGIPISCEKDGDIKPIGGETRVILIKSVRELLNNAVKHAKAKNIHISIKKSKAEIHVTVTDDGIGFDVHHIKMRVGRNGGFGLFSIRESLKHLGGSITIRSASAKGTAITLKAPLKVLRRGHRK